MTEIFFITSEKQGVAVTGRGLGYTWESVTLVSAPQVLDLGILLG